ncbi:MAG TPA: SDR family NAD(P)-dependent oxidoreductase [Bryobacteraceae bacterium]|nr:SDR family NAD(P)-dependent oxidoreductase [Bryobacteraceae bacterium]
MKMTGNSILITGGGSGIGEGLARAFHKLGNHVIVAGRRREVLEKSGFDYVVLDTRDRSAIARSAVEVARRFPDLNVVINNAGVQRQHDFSGPVNEMAIAEEIETNILGVIGMAAEFLPRLKSKPSATLINVSSGLAFVPMARFPVYCATKAFVHSFTLSLRHQLRNTSVRVIELAPPWVATDLGAGHSTLESTSGRGPMPLDAFIEAAMQDLASDLEVLPVAGAKFLYGSGVGAKAAEAFAQMNG